MKKDILVIFGGVSPEHEVSIITGLQVIEAIDRSKYSVHGLYITQSGDFQLLPQMKSRKDFRTSRRSTITFGHDKHGGFISHNHIFSQKIHLYCAYVALHGGNGEGGAIQGLLDSIGIPYTSPSYESSVILMNKALTKQCVSQAGIPTIPGMSFTSIEIDHEFDSCIKRIETELHLPAIIKPAHLGSSIGISIAHTRIELEKFLKASTFVDTEIIVEKFLSSIIEFNCAVRLINDQLETSEIEKPVSHDEFLTFAEKYERGGKKTQQGGGMATLERELPAKIEPHLRDKIKTYAQNAFRACRCTGMVRIDFIYADGELYLSEINAIPGSMSFYLWEATGIQFKDQVSDLIESSVELSRKKSLLRLEYDSKIVDTFLEINQ